MGEFSEFYRARKVEEGFRNPPHRSLGWPDLFRRRPGVMYPLLLAQGGCLTTFANVGPAPGGWPISWWVATAAAWAFACCALALSFRHVAREVTRDEGRTCWY